MRVLVVEPEQRPEVREIDDSLTAMQGIVGGLIQPIYLENSVVLQGVPSYYALSLKGVERV